MCRPCAGLLALATLSAGDPGRVIVPRGTGWGNAAWPDNGKDDLGKSSSGYAYVEVDLFDQQSKIKTYKDAGHLVFCYFSIGTLEEHRPDGDCTINKDTPSCKKNQDIWDELNVGPMDEWSELWLDVGNPKLKDIMGKRIELAKDLGCHGIEPDNIDCYDNSPCKKSVSKSAQKEFNKWTVQHAHSLGLSVCAKNDHAFLSDIDYDCAVVEQGFQYTDTDAWKSFASKGKAVFGIEYKDHDICSKAEDIGMSLIYCKGGKGDNEGDCCGKDSDWCSSPVPMKHCRHDSSLPKIECTDGSYDTSMKSCGGSSSPRRRSSPPRRRSSPTRRRSSPSRRRSSQDWCSRGISKSNDGVLVCCGKCNGQCGGSGCGDQPGGASQCCANTISEDGEECQTAEDTGCIIPSSSTPRRRRSSQDWCSRGISKSNDGVLVCCGKCNGQCGGSGCGDQPGGASQCCANKISEEGEECQTAEDTGCIIPSSQTALMWM